MGEKHDFLSLPGMFLSLNAGDGGRGVEREKRPQLDSCGTARQRVD